MRIVFILFLCIYTLFAYEVKIKNIQNDEIRVDKYVKKGVSGIVLCSFENREIICARAVLFGTKGKLEIYDNLKNDSFALPIVTPKVGDKIILAKDYNRIMIIAPNQDAYLRVKNFLKNKIVVSTDIFVTFLDEIPTKEDFVNFAKKLDIGLYAFVIRNKLYLVDAYSFYVIKKYSLNKNYNFNTPFFVTYNNFQMEKSVFSKIKNLFKSDIKNFNEYYKSLIKG
jgi:hypothetical protein